MLKNINTYVIFTEKGLFNYKGFHSTQEVTQWMIQCNECKNVELHIVKSNKHYKRLVKLFLENCFKLNAEDYPYEEK